MTLVASNRPLWPVSGAYNVVFPGHECRDRGYGSVRYRTVVHKWRPYGGWVQGR